MAKAKHIIIKVIPDETIIRKIYILRDQKVMLDMDLAELYEVETKYLKRQVNRNIERFPEDFLFQLSSEEFKILRSQFGTSSLPAGKAGWGGTRYLPFAFTEQGVAMLSGVINSPKAIEMNIAIMRAFVEIRKLAHSHIVLAKEVKKIVAKVGEHDVQLAAIYEAIENLLDEKVAQKSWEGRQRIGFKK
ncbi:MAG: ORF6N domain-containing protein [Ferruginibacter sp.]